MTTKRKLEVIGYIEDIIRQYKAVNNCEGICIIINTLFKMGCITVVEEVTMVNEIRSEYKRINNTDTLPYGYWWRTKGISWTEKGPVEEKETLHVSGWYKPRLEFLDGIKEALHDSFFPNLESYP